MDTFTNFFSSIILSVVAFFGFATSAPIHTNSNTVVSSTSVNQVHLPSKSLENGQNKKTVATEPTSSKSIANKKSVISPKLSEASSLKREEDFTLQIPDGWESNTVTNYEGGKLLSITSPDFKGETVVIGFEGSWTANKKSLQTQTPQEYVDEKFAHYAQFGDKVQQKQMFLGGQPAHRRMNTLVGAQITTIYTLYNHREFVIRYIPENGNWTEAQDKVIDAIIAHFKFKN